MGKRKQFRQGVYTVKHRQKYTGKTPPIFRSSWEMDFMYHLDTHPAVKGWCSECVVIPYSYAGKTRRYYPDFLVEWLHGLKQLVEIKPYRETLPPRKTKKKSRKTLIYEAMTYEKNQAKWDAAQYFCKKRGWEFKVLTEKNL